MGRGNSSSSARVLLSHESWLSFALCQEGCEGFWVCSCAPRSRTAPRPTSAAASSWWDPSVEPHGWRALLRTPACR